MKTGSSIRVAVISAFPPVSDNYKAPNSLPFQLLKYRPNNVNVDLFYFKQIEVKPDVIKSSFAQLNLSSSHEINSSSYSYLDKIKYFFNRFINRNEIKNFPGVVQSFLPPNKIIKQIKEGNYDLVWLYPNWMYYWIEPLKSIPTVISGMDAASLHYIRCIDLKLAKDVQELNEMNLAYKNYRNLEGSTAMMKIPVHMVGKMDAEFYNNNSDSNLAYFIPHPHNELSSENINLLATSRKLELIITGQVESIYIRFELDRVIDMFVDNAEDFKKYYNLNFVGPGFENISEKLLKLGYQVKFDAWVDDFAKTLSLMHIQLFPIDVGTGSKGKVLHALASGLLGIGTELAFENIEANSGIDYLIYKNTEELKGHLLSLVNNQKYYADIAVSGKLNIRKNHSPKITSTLFWNKLFQNILVVEDKD